MCQSILSGNVPIDNSSFLLHKEYLYFKMIKIQDQPSGCFTSRTTTSAKTTTTTKTITLQTTSTSKSTTTLTQTTITSITTTTSTTPTTITTTPNAVLVLSTYSSNNKPLIVGPNGKFIMFFLMLILFIQEITI